MPLERKTVRKRRPSRASPSPHLTEKRKKRERQAWPQPRVPPPPPQVHRRRPPPPRLRAPRLHPGCPALAARPTHLLPTSAQPQTGTTTGDLRRLPQQARAPLSRPAATSCRSTSPIDRSMSTLQPPCLLRPESPSSVAGDRRQHPPTRPSPARPGSWTKDNQLVSRKLATSVAVVPPCCCQILYSLVAVASDACTRCCRRCSYVDAILCIDRDKLLYDAVLEVVCPINQ